MERIRRILPYSVLSSAGGFYIGRRCIIDVLSESDRVIDTYEDFYDRLGGYYETNEEASASLG